MIKFSTFAAAALLALAAAPLAHAGEGTFRPGTYALGFSGAPAQTASTRALPTYNEGMGGDMRLGRPAASVMGPAGKPIADYGFNGGSNGNG
jgi:hypothetical protein